MVLASLVVRTTCTKEDVDSGACGELSSLNTLQPVECWSHTRGWRMASVCQVVTVGLEIMSSYSVNNVLPNEYLIHKHIIMHHATLSTFSMEIFSVSCKV